MPRLSDHNPTCANVSCSKPGARSCKRCSLVKYCCRECQVDHWKEHKSFCTTMNVPHIRAKFSAALDNYDRGMDLHYLNRNEEALELLLKAHEVNLELLGEHNINTSNSHHMLGCTYVCFKRYNEANYHLQQALAIRKEIVGENHKFTACAYDAIGMLMASKKRYDDALIGYGKALGIRLRVLGEDSFDVGASHHNIGRVLMNKGQYDQALESLRKAQLIFLCKAGEDHIDTIKVNNSINEVLRKKERKVAEENEKKAEEKLRKKFSRQAGKKIPKKLDLSTQHEGSGVAYTDSYVFQFFFFLTVVGFSYYILFLAPHP